MKRALPFIGLGIVLLGVAGGGAAIAQRIEGERQYRRLLDAGEQALASGDSYAAIEAFSGALAFRPESMVAHFRRGEAYALQRRIDEAERDLRAASRLAPSAPQPLVALGDLFQSIGEDAQAADWYAQAADRLKDEDPSVLYRLSLAHYRAGAPAAAVDPLRRAVARNTSLPEAHYLLGLILRDTGDDAGAIEALERAVDLDPALMPAREELVDLYRAEGRAVDEMAQLQALASRDSQVMRRVDIGMAESRRGQFDGALGTLNSALDDSPNDSRIQLAIGRVYLARAERGGDPDATSRAIEALERALGGTARRSEGLALYGRALTLAGKYADAERILRDAVATSPIDLEAFQFLADVAERLGHHVIARDALVNLDALQGDTATPEARRLRARRIGTLSFRAADYREANEYLTFAAEGGLSDPALFAELAQARWLAGDRDGARAALARGLSAYPSDSSLQRLSRTLK